MKANTIQAKTDKDIKVDIQGLPNQVTEALENKK
ncbi:hypothetical protein SDC9_179212 [bioreactor metagenome]|uniref:Uncharacterized protein n=1 Tax=bioreactor metagenome TaxID=1076179 RepID=A0A645GYD2_9ZZZZ